MSTRQRGSKLRGEQDVNIARYGGVDVGLSDPILISIVESGIIVDPRDRNWVLNQLIDSVQVTPIAASVWDISDRWAREVGQIDLARVLGVALTSANPVISGIFDAAGNRMPSMDVAARPGYVDVIDRWARTLGQFDLARVLGAALTSANPVIAGIFDVAGNRMPSMDVCARAGYTQTCFGGVIVDPRNIRALTATDVVTVVETEGTLDHGSNLDIDTVAEQITANAFPAKHGVCFKADKDNTGVLYLGNSDVTSGVAAATDGIPLEAGESITLPIDNPSLVYAIASENNQKIFWIAV